MPRPFLFESLQAIWPRSLVADIMHSWHADAHYVVTTNTFEDCAPTQLGIRQGCTGTPALWSVAMWYLLQKVHNLLGHGFWNASIPMISM